MNGAATQAATIGVIGDVHLFWDEADIAFFNRGDYDLAIYVANWPAKRRVHWRQLLIARAIENLACVVGVNRVGADAKGLQYSGDSLAINADGTLIADLQDGALTHTIRFEAKALEDYRAAFPCHLDADDFKLDESLPQSPTE